ncbi:MAG: HAMP domain-containing histidine kinase [Methylomicrobium sp.]|nr:HAMP domain-containing histidine kinase [Methylomicrobium sp.]
MYDFQSGGDFERDLNLDELLKGIDKSRLVSALNVLLDTTVGVVDDTGASVIGDNSSKTVDGVPLHGELEPVGFLQTRTAVPSERLSAAADLMQLILRCNARYLLASDIHLQTQRDDFEELQRRNVALQASEARYKKLSESLEIRVKEQVKTIEKAHLKLYRNEKQASVGRLAAGVAHEINNPLGFIRSNVATAASYLESFYEFNALIDNGASSKELRKVWEERELPLLLDDFKDLMKESLEGLDRIAKIVIALKGFSRIDQTETERADIDTIVRQICQVAESQWQQKAKLVLELSSETPIQCQSAQLGQVVYGLLANAVDAIEKNGIIRIRTAVRNGAVVLEVQDNGQGIPETVLPHVFEPFFTTKEVGQGTGLGLTVCHDIVKEHGGTIDIVSQIGKGTRVTVNLPVQNAIQHPNAVQHSRES